MYRLNYRFPSRNRLQFVHGVTDSRRSGRYNGTVVFLPGAIMWATFGTRYLRPHYLIQRISHTRSRCQTLPVRIFWKVR